MDTKALHIHMSVDLIRRIDEFRWRNRLASRKESLEWLVNFALAQKPKMVEAVETAEEVAS